jgi:hypothetical protein
MHSIYALLIYDLKQILIMKHRHFFEPNYFLSKLLLSAACVTYVHFLPFSNAAQLIPKEMQDIADAYRKQEKALDSLYIAIHFQTEAAGTSSDIGKYLHSICLVNENRIFAFKKNMRYSKMESSTGGVYDHLTEKLPNGIPRKVETNPNGEWAYDGKNTYVINSALRQKLAMIILPERDSDDDSVYFNENYMSMIYRSLPYVIKKKKPEYLLNLSELIEQGKCRLSTTKAVVDGAKCIGIELDDKALWCDPQLGYAVRKCEEYFASDKTLAKCRYYYSDFVNVADGVWLPKKCACDTYGTPDSPSQLHNVPLLRARYEVKEIHANDVSDELFTPAIPPGSLVNDGRYLHDKQTLCYTMPANAKDLDAVIKSCLTGKDYKPTKRSIWQRMGIGIMFLGLGLSTGVFIYRMRKRNASIS